MFTVKQIAALKYMIFKSKDGTELSKRVLAFLIDYSMGLTKEVCLTLMEGRDGYTAEEIDKAARGVGAMASSNCCTHVQELLHVMGSDFHFSVHYGDFDPGRTGDPFSSNGMFPGLDVSQVPRPELVIEGMPLRYTFWLAREYYSRKSALVVPTFEQLDRIDLKKSGLYQSC